MKNILCLLLILWSSAILSAQNQHPSSFQNIDLLGFDLDEGNFDDLNPKVDSLIALGVSLKVFGNYGLDSYREYENFDYDLDRISSGPFIAIGVYNLLNGIKGRVKINNPDLGLGMTSALEFELEHLISLKATYDVQGFIRLIQSCVDRYLSTYEEQFFFQIGQANRSSGGGEFVTAFHELKKEASFLSLSGIPFKLPKGTFITFVKGKVGCKKCNDQSFYPLKGTVFSFIIGEDVYIPAIYEDPAHPSKTYFGGYKMKGAQEIELFRAELENDATVKIFLGMETRNCGGVEWNQYKFKKKWIDDITPSKIGGPLVTQDQIFDQLETKIIVEYRENIKLDKIYTIEREVLAIEHQEFAPRNCDFDIDPIELDKLLACDAITLLRHKNGSYSTTFNTRRGKINLYIDSEGETHHRLYDLQRHIWVPIYKQSNTDFINELNAIAEGSLHMMSVCFLTVGSVYVSIVVPQAAPEAWTITAALLTDIALAGVTYLTTGDSNAAIVELVFAGAGGGVSAFFKLKAARKVVGAKEGVKAIAGEGSVAYKQAKKVHNKDHLVDVVKVKRRQADGSYINIDLDQLHNRMKTQLGMSNDDFIKFADNLDALGKDQYKLLGNWGMVKSWKNLFESADPGIKALRTDVPSLQKFDDIVQSNNLGLDENGLKAVLDAAAVKGQQWDFPENILDAVKRASDGNIPGMAVKHKKFPTPSEGSDPFVLKNAKQYQKEASGDAGLSFEVGGRSFDDVA